MAMPNGCILYIFLEMAQISMGEQVAAIGLGIQTKSGPGFRSKAVPENAGEQQQPRPSHVLKRHSSLAQGSSRSGYPGYRSTPAPQACRGWLPPATIRNHPVFRRSLTSRPARRPPDPGTPTPIGVTELTRGPSAATTPGPAPPNTPASRRWCQTARMNKSRKIVNAWSTQS